MRDTRRMIGSWTERQQHELMRMVGDEEPVDPVALIDLVRGAVNAAARKVA